MSATELPRILTRRFENRAALLDALAALLARDPALTAARAVASRAAIEVWTEPDALPHE